MKRIFTLFICFFTCFAAFFSASCAKTKDYFDYVSEYRQNVLLAANGDNLLKIYASNKEYPYKADGIKRPTSTVCEFFFYAPSGENNYVLSFHYDGKTHGGDLSYDRVKNIITILAHLTFLNVNPFRWTFSQANKNKLITLLPS